MLAFLTDSVDQVRKFILANPDHRFTSEEIENSPDLQTAAELFAANYTGDFEFMLDMKAAVLRTNNPGLSAAQAKGVLNCMRAEVLRETHKVEELPPALEPVMPKLRDGTYTVVAADGSHITLRVKRVHWGDFPKGTQQAQYLFGPDNEVNYASFAFVFGDQVKVWRRFNTPEMQSYIQALNVLLSDEDPGKFGYAYALESGNCWRCGRKLTVPASIHRGMGPKCAEMEA